MVRETSRISVPAEREQATIVRQFVRLACHRYGCDAVVDNILQVTDELVANAMAHGSPDPETTVDIGIIPTQSGVRIEVHDHVHTASEADLHRQAADEQAAEENGIREVQHGLQIVSSLASSWGVTEDPDGKVVWAEMSGSALPAHA